MFTSLYRFLKSKTENDLIRGNYFNTFPADKGFNFENVKKITLKSVETIEIEIYEEHVKELFTRNRKQIRERLIKDKRQMGLNSKG